MKKQRFRAKRRRARRGVTLVEVLIVVAIIAIVSASVGLAAWRYKEGADIKMAATNAREIRAALKVWWTDHDGAECPNVEELVRDQTLDRDWPRVDPWGKAWRIECGDHDVTIYSNGHDRLPGTADDIRIPPA